VILSSLAKIHNWLEKSIKLLFMKVYIRIREFYLKPSVRLLINQEIGNEIRKIVKNAKQSLFILSPDISSQALEWLLEPAIKKNVKLTIITAKKSYEKALQTLQKLNLESHIFENDNLHAKIVMNDDEAIVSSSNISSAGLWIAGKGNLECGLYTRQREIVNSLKSFINTVLSDEHGIPAYKSNKLEIYYGPWQVVGLLKQLLSKMNNGIFLITPYLGLEAVDRFLSPMQGNVRLNIVTSLRKSYIKNALTDLAAIRNLLNKGAQIKRRDDLHAKCLIVDGKLGVLGTFNFTFDGILTNYEIAILLKDVKLIKNLAEFMEKISERSKEIGFKDLSEIESKVRILPPEGKITDKEKSEPEVTEKPLLLLRIEEYDVKNKVWIPITDGGKIRKGSKMQLRIIIENGSSEKSISDIVLHTSENITLNKKEVEVLKPLDQVIIEGYVQMPNEDKTYVKYKVRVSYFDGEKWRRSKSYEGSKETITVITKKGIILRVLSNDCDQLKKNLGREPLLNEFKEYVCKMHPNGLVSFILETFPELNVNNKLNWDALFRKIQLFRFSKYQPE